MSVNQHGTVTILQKYVNELHKYVNRLQKSVNKSTLFCDNFFLQEQNESRCQAIIFVSQGASAKQNFLWFREHVKTIFPFMYYCKKVVRYRYYCSNYTFILVLNLMMETFFVNLGTLKSYSSMSLRDIKCSRGRRQIVCECLIIHSHLLYALTKLCK